MALEIVDGTGTGKKAKVNGQNRLRTQAVTSTLDQDINERTGKVWSLPFENISPTAGDDYVFYIKNTGDKDIEISDFRVSTETAGTQIKVESVSGTAAGGTDISPISRTIGSAAIPSATMQIGNDITGLSSDGVIFHIQCPVVGTLYRLSTSSKIVIPKGKALALSVETSTASITGIVSVYEKE